MCVCVRACVRIVVWGIYSTYLNMRQNYPPPNVKKLGGHFIIVCKFRHSVLVGIFLKLKIVKDGGLILQYIWYWQLKYNSATQSSICWSMNVF